MAGTDRKGNLGQAMGLLGLDARQVGSAIGVSNSLVSRWQRGTRPLTYRSKGLVPLAEFLLEQDAGHLTHGLLAPYRTNGETALEAMCSFLTDDLPASMPARIEPPAMQTSGEFSRVEQVLLGKSGFQKAFSLMVGYLRRLPPGREAVVCAHGGLALFWHASPAFAIAIIRKLRQAAARDAHFTLVMRRGDEIAGSPYFSVFWLTQQMRATLRCRFYEGDPPDEYFSAMIPGYFSAVVEPDEEAEDGIITTIATDARSIRSGERKCRRYLEKSTSAAWFGFFDDPAGLVREYDRRPALDAAHLSDIAKLVSIEGAEEGVFTGTTVLSRVPSLGLMTEDEAKALLGEGICASLPDFLLNDDPAFTQKPYRVILCREDVREGLVGDERRNEVLSALAKRDVCIPREMLHAQMKRIQRALREVEGFELAIVPRVAFEKLGIGMVNEQGRGGLSWLQDCSESMYGCDPTVIDSFDMAAEYLWRRLRSGWKRHRTTTAYLRKWLAGSELDTPLEDSTTVQNWDVLPKK